jgi:alpha-1,3-rhamnosyl/mannosyltransferase
VNKPRVGIDARYVTHHAVGGYQTYVQQLLAGFSRIQTDVEVWAILTSESQRVAAIENIEHVVEPTPVPFLGIPWREQVSVPRRAVHIGLDLVHYPSNTMPLWPRRRSVVTVHDTLALRRRRRPAGWRNRVTSYYESLGMRTALYRASLLITPSAVARGELIEAGVAEGRVRVIPEAVNPVFFTRIDSESVRLLRTRYGLESDYLVTFASDDPRKNVPAVIDALALLTRHPELRLAILMSSNGLRHELMARAESRRLAHRVVFVPRLPAPDLPVLLSGAACMVFASLAEGFGLPPLECMACETPVVCSDRPPLDELYTEAALMVDPTRPADIALQLDRILSEAPLRQQLVQRGRALAARRTWDNVAAQTAQAYLAAMETGHAQQRTPAAAKGGG